MKEGKGVVVSQSAVERWNENKQAARSASSNSINFIATISYFCSISLKLSSVSFVWVIISGIFSHLATFIKLLLCVCVSSGEGEQKAFSS